MRGQRSHSREQLAFIRMMSDEVAILFAMLEAGVDPDNELHLYKLFEHAQALARSADGLRDARRPRRLRLVRGARS